MDGKKQIKPLYIVLLIATLTAIAISTTVLLIKQQPDTSAYTPAQPGTTHQITKTQTYRIQKNGRNLDQDPSAQTIETKLSLFTVSSDENTLKLLCLYGSTFTDQEDFEEEEEEDDWKNLNLVYGFIDLKSGEIQRMLKSETASKHDVDQCEEAFRDMVVNSQVFIEAKGVMSKVSREAGCQNYGGEPRCGETTVQKNQDAVQVSRSYTPDPNSDIQVNGVKTVNVDNATHRLIGIDTVGTISITDSVQGRRLQSSDEFSISVQGKTVIEESNDFEDEDEFNEFLQAIEEGTELFPVLDADKPSIQGRGLDGNVEILAETVKSIGKIHNTDVNLVSKVGKKPNGMFVGMYLNITGYPTKVIIEEDVGEETVAVVKQIGIVWKDWLDILVQGNHNAQIAITNLNVFKKDTRLLKKVKSAFTSLKLLLIGFSYSFQYEIEYYANEIADKFRELQGDLTCATPQEISQATGYLLSPAEYAYSRIDSIISDMLIRIDAISDYSKDWQNQYIENATQITDFMIDVIPELQQRQDPAYADINRFVDDVYDVKDFSQHEDQVQAYSQIAFEAQTLVLQTNMQVTQMAKRDLVLSNYKPVWDGAIDSVVEQMQIYMEGFCQDSTDAVIVLQTKKDDFSIILEGLENAIKFLNLDDTVEGFQLAATKFPQISALISTQGTVFEQYIVNQLLTQSKKWGPNKVIDEQINLGTYKSPVADIDLLAYLKISAQFSENVIFFQDTIIDKSIPMASIEMSMEKSASINSGTYNYVIQNYMSSALQLDLLAYLNPIEFDVAANLMCSSVQNFKLGYQELKRGTTRRCKRKWYGKLRCRTIHHSAWQSYVQAIDQSSTNGSCDAELLEDTEVRFQ